MMSKSKFQVDCHESCLFNIGSQQLYSISHSDALNATLDYPYAKTWKSHIKNKYDVKIYPYMAMVASEATQGRRLKYSYITGIRIYHLLVS